MDFTSTRTLEIDGMTCDSCVEKVAGALAPLEDVWTHDVSVGAATIGADEAGSQAACAAIGAAGFSAREKKRPYEPVLDAAPRAIPSGHKGGGLSSRRSPASSAPAQTVKRFAPNPTATPGDAGRAHAAKGAGPTSRTKETS